MDDITAKMMPPQVEITNSVIELTTWTHSQNINCNSFDKFIYDLKYLFLIKVITHAMH